MPELASTLLPLLALFGVFWLLIIRPQSKRNKAMAELHAALAEGDRVITTSGILGTVRGLDGDKVSLEVAPGVEITVVRAAIGGKEPDRADAPTQTDEPRPEA